MKMQWKRDLIVGYQWQENSWREVATRQMGWRKCEGRKLLQRWARVKQHGGEVAARQVGGGKCVFILSFTWGWGGNTVLKIITVIFIISFVTVAQTTTMCLFHFSTFHWMFFLVFCPLPISLLCIIFLLAVIVSFGSQWSEAWHYEISYSLYMYLAWWFGILNPLVAETSVVAESAAGAPRWFDSVITCCGAHDSAVGWGTALQVGRSRVWFPMVSLEFFIDVTLPAALWPWGWLSL